MEKSKSSLGSSPQPFIERKTFNDFHLFSVDYFSLLLLCSVLRLILNFKTFLQFLSPLMTFFFLIDLNTGQLHLFYTNGQLFAHILP